MSKEDHTKLVKIVRAEAKDCKDSAVMENQNPDYTDAFWCASIVLNSLAEKLEKAFE